MIEIVLDVSANTFKNDVNYFKRMVDEIKKIDSKEYKITFKTQLFEPTSKAAEVNECLLHDTFIEMHRYCNQSGYQLTSSVFDLYSLKFLLEFNIPFVKIACRPETYFLLGFIPRKIHVYISTDCRKNCSDFPYYGNEHLLECIPEYPASEEDYLKHSFQKGRWELNISDHTPGMYLFKKFVDYKKMEEGTYIFEMHYVLERDAKNPDAGLFAKTIDELRGML